MCDQASFVKSDSQFSMFLYHTKLNIALGSETKYIFFIQLDSNRQSLTYKT